MNDPTIIAAAIVTVIAALVTGTVTVINAISSRNDRHEANIARTELKVTADKTDKKADAIIQKTTEIHVLTNSNLARVTESLNIALQKIDGLEKLIQTMNDAKRVEVALAIVPSVQADKDKAKEVVKEIVK